MAKLGILAVVLLAGCLVCRSTADAAQEARIVS